MKKLLALTFVVTCAVLNPVFAETTETDTELKDLIAQLNSEIESSSSETASSAAPTEETPAQPEASTEDSAAE